MKKERVIINGKPAKRREAESLAVAFGDRKILNERGGYLFKVCGIAPLSLGVQPVLFEGERGYHYNIVMGEEGKEPLIIGTVSASGIFTLLCKPPLAAQRDEPFPSKEYRELYTRFAQFLKRSSYRGEGRLDTVTSRLLAEKKIFSHPVSSLDDMISAQPS